MRRGAALALLVAAAACDNSGRDVRRDGATDAPGEALPGFDAPPPSVDAGPPPQVSCAEDAGTCQLPPSVCLDANYLIYYTGGTCDQGTCSFMTNLMYCTAGCVSGGCLGGFT